MKNTQLLKNNAVPHRASGILIRKKQEEEIGSIYFSMTSSYITVLSTMEDVARPVWMHHKIQSHSQSA